VEFDSFKVGLPHKPRGVPVSELPKAAGLPLTSSVQLACLGLETFSQGELSRRRDGE
jgi:hypothetical protein